MTTIKSSIKTILLGLLVMALWGTLFPMIKLGYAAFGIPSSDIPSIILFAGLLSFIVLYNLNNINITERRRELATLKVLGFYNGEVAMYVYRENIMLTLFGTLVGCLLGKFLHYFTIITVEVDSAMFGRKISLQSYLICARFTICFSIIVNAIMFFKLKTIDMVESLKSVE